MNRVEAPDGDEGGFKVGVEAAMVVPPSLLLRCAIDTDDGETLKTKKSAYTKKPSNGSLGRNPVTYCERSKKGHSRRQVKS